MNWTQVEHHVPLRYLGARQLGVLLKTAAAEHKLPPRTVGWDPDTERVIITAPDNEIGRWRAALRNLPQTVCFGPQEFGVIKLADAGITASGALAPLRWLYDTAGRLTGGPSPLTNGLVNMALGGAAGYGAGKLNRLMMGEQNVDPDDPDRAARVFSRLGMAAGAATIPLQAYVNNSISTTPLGLSSLATPLSRIHVKSGAAGVMLRPVPVDAFNRAIWSDALKGVNPYGTKSGWGDDSQSLHTPPGLAATTAGMLKGVQASRGFPDIVSTHDIANSLLNAGLGWGQARVVANTVGFLAGLHPQTQDTIQNTGMWAGLLHSTVGNAFNN